MNLIPILISRATGSSIEDAKKFAPYLNKYMAKYGINTPERAMSFLAQIGTESASLRATQEYASGQAYEGRSDLGNTNAGDGVKYKGRGLIQITGRGNYQGVKDNFGWDVVNNPQLLEGLDKATEVSAWWYAKRKRSGLTLNEWADKIDVKKPINQGDNAYVFEQITRAINGGVNGLSDRMKNFSNSQQYYQDFKADVENWFSKWWSIPLVIAVLGTSLYFIIKQIKKTT